MPIEKVIRETQKAYEEPHPISEYEWDDAVSSGETGRIASALVSTAFFEQSWQQSQDKCLLFVDNPERAISGVAAICLGHIARIHHQLDLSTVLPLLHRLQSDNPSVGEYGDALDDIAIFVQSPSPVS